MSFPEDPVETTPLLSTQGQSLGARQGNHHGRQDRPQVTQTEPGTDDNTRAHPSRRDSVLAEDECFGEDLERQETRSYGTIVVEETLGKGVDASSQPPSDSKYINIRPAKFWLVFMTILLSYFIGHFDLTLMASSHPIITSYFNASQEASWLTTAFMITNTGFQPLWGRLSDMLGRKVVYLTALGIFVISNLWCGVADSIGSIIAARALCGVGVGGAMSMGLVIINDMVRIEHRGTYLSHANLASGMGCAFGAAFGGIICDLIGWRWAFGVQVPILFACTILAMITIPNDLGRDANDEKTTESSTWKALQNFDSAGLVTLVLAITFITMFLNVGGNQFAWSHPFTILCAVAGVSLSIIGIMIEKNAEYPVLPLHLLTTSPHMNLTYANFLAGFATNTVLFNAPLWFQAVKLDTPSASGLRLTAPAIGGSLTAVLAGFLITWTGRLKTLLVLGASMYVLGSAGLLFLRRDLSFASQIALLTPVPLSQGFVYPTSMIAALAVSPQADQGVVTTTLCLGRNLGIVMGVATSSLVFQNALSSFLSARVKGPDALRIVGVARRNVAEIRGLPGMYRDQVIDSYASALKLSFVAASVASIVLFMLMVPLKLPRLRKGEKMLVRPGE